MASSTMTPCPPPRWRLVGSSTLRESGADRRGDRTPSARAAGDQPQTQESERPVRPLVAERPPGPHQQSSTPTVRSERYWVCTLMSSMAPFQTPRVCRGRLGYLQERAEIWLPRPKSGARGRVKERAASSKSSGSGASNDIRFRSTGWTKAETPRVQRLTLKGIGRRRPPDRKHIALRRPACDRAAAPGSESGSVCPSSAGLRRGTSFRTSRRLCTG